MASDQQFCLRWNNHQSTLVSVFDNLLESQTLVDCTLAADGQYLKAHKVVLSACSPYLEAILCQNLDKHPILILKDVKFSELKAMLDYMYRGEVNISQEQLSTFLKAAESLQIKGLTDSGGGGSSDREREPLKRQDLRKPLNQPVPHIPQPRPVVPHPGLMERRSLPHFPPHIADMQPQSPRHAREGSTSPTARKRRRPNRPSSDDSNFVSTPNSLSENQPDTSDSCDVPVKQAASSTPNVPNATTKAPETDSNRTTPQPQNNQQNSEQKQQVSVKKEFSETLLTPKTEFDYGNDNSMEDVTYEDDEEEEVDLSKPGTSFAANSQGFPPWQMGGDGSNDDSNNMYSPDVTAATNQNNSQGKSKPRALGHFLRSVRPSKDFQKSSTCKQENCTPQSSPEKSPGKIPSVAKKGRRSFGKRIACPKCDEYVLKRVFRLHRKYYCGKQFDEKEWKLYSSQALCLKCQKCQDPNSIEFHVKYLCGKNPITVQCFYCTQLFKDYKNLLGHMRAVHKRRHNFLDFLSILPDADSACSKNAAPKILKNFFSNMLNIEQEAIVVLDKDSSNPLQLRNKSTQKCNTCGKVLEGIHEYVNHVNRKCGSENYYPCFYCNFTSELAYEVLDHMEEIHGNIFNTFDIIHARMTGVIPVNNLDSVNNTNDLADRQESRIEDKKLPREKSMDKAGDLYEKSSMKTRKIHDARTSDKKSENGTNRETYVRFVPSEDPEDKIELAIKSPEYSAIQVLKIIGIRDVKDRTESNTSDRNLQDEQNIQLNYSSEENDTIEIPRNRITDSETAESQISIMDEHCTNGDIDLKLKKMSNEMPLPLRRSTETNKENNVSGGILPQINEASAELMESVVVRGILGTGCNGQMKCKSDKLSKGNSNAKSNKGNTSLKGTSPKKSTRIPSTVEDVFVTEDIEVDFANKHLFEPFYSSAKRLKSESQDVNTAMKPKSLPENSSTKSNTHEHLPEDPLDSEVDFLNKELFEPYEPPTDMNMLNSRLFRAKTEDIMKSPKKGLLAGSSSEASSSDKRVSSRSKTRDEANQDIDNKCTAKVGLKVTRRKVVIGKSIIKPTGKVKRKPVCKIYCSKCHRYVHPGDLRIHNKYHCPKEPKKKQWILCSGKALCLRCQKLQLSNGIDFHIKYLCNRKRFPLQCFYCSKIGNEYRSVITHMALAHGKKHYYPDLMSILPDPEVGSPENTQSSAGGSTMSLRTVKHPITFYAREKSVSENEDGQSYNHSDDEYPCFYCEFRHLKAFKTLDHMEETHKTVHNLYDLLNAKMPERGK